MSGEVLPTTVKRKRIRMGFPLPGRIIDVHNHGRADSDGSDLVELMDAHQIEKAVILGVPSEYSATNKATLAAVRAHPDRLVGGAFADPREGERAVEEIRRYPGGGFLILMLSPNSAYHPAAAAVRPFFHAVAELKMAVLSHCGWLSPKPGFACAAYYSHPGRFEKVIRLYPETIFIMAHMGGIAGFLETVMLTTRTPNTYADCSPGQGLWVLESAPAIAATIPVERLMWGCDSYDYPRLIPRYHAALENIGFGPHLEKIFHDNARGLLEKIGAIEKSEPADEGT